MLKNFFAIALRNFQRQLIYSVINITGLAVGIACSLVIFLYVYGEWHYDHHFQNGDRIYRIGVSFFNLGKFAKGPELLKEHLPKDFEGVEVFTSFNNSYESLHIGDQLFKDVVYFIDSSFFKVFKYPFLEGDPATAVMHENSVIITDNMARKLFNDVHVMGRIIEIGKEKVPYTVTGIVRNEQKHSHLKTSVWALRRAQRSDYYAYWPSAAVYNYVLLRHHSSEQDLHLALDRIIEKYVYPASGMQQVVSLENYRQNENAVRFFVHPLRDIYLKSKMNLELSPGGNETNLYVFSIVASFILVLAAVNFVNLATARAARRSKEVGIRKSLGTSKAKLVMQFLLESVMVSVVAMIVALGFAELFLFAFYWITGESLAVQLWGSVVNILAALVLAIVIGLVAGIYPAFYLTSFAPVKVLKGLTHTQGGVNFRNGLVIFQFAVSITLIIGTAVILQQLNFMRHKDLGFDHQNVLCIDNIPQLKNHATGFKEDLLKQNGVLHASLHSGQPGSKNVMTVVMFQTPAMTQPLSINTYLTDYDYIDVMALKIIQGRKFDPDLASDSAAVILNESAVQALNLGENPIGAEVNKGIRVIGVVSNFHWESLRHSIAPLVIMLYNKKIHSGGYAQLALRVQGENIEQVLRVAGQKWKAFGVDEPFQYHFLDENFGAYLKKEEILGKAISFFAVLAIIISCLGVLGLAAYTTEQRKKEIGIRKVFGASLARIYFMLNSQYVRLIAIAMIFSVPVAWWVMRAWLDTFSYKIKMHPWWFLAAGGIELVAALACVGYLAVRAASLNPAKVLKEE